MLNFDFLESGLVVSPQFVYEFLGKIFLTYMLYTFLIIFKELSVAKKNFQTRECASIEPF